MSLEFVDTNVLIYSHDTSAGAKRQRALELVRDLTSQDSGALSVQVLSEFYWIATRKLSVASSTAEEVISNFGAWTIHQPTHADILRAVDLHRKLKTSWWDALILNSAIELGCETLWTEDFHHGQRVSGVTVRNPFRLSRCTIGACATFSAAAFRTPPASCLLRADLAG